MKRSLLTLAALLVLTTLVYSQGTATPSSLRVRTDANGYLLVSSVAQTNPISTSIFTSTRLRTDASNNLQVILAGTITPTFPQSIPASTCAAPSLGLSGNPDVGIAFTATPSLLDCIEGVAVTTTTGSAYTSTIPIEVTSSATIGVKVSTISPRIRLNSTATGSSSYGFENGGVFLTNAISWVRATNKITFDDGGLGILIPSVNGIGFIDTAWSVAAPSIASGFCTTPVVTTHNGTASFVITIGTGCAASTGTITMPNVGQGWVCNFINETVPASNIVNQSGGGSTTVTVVNYARTTGVASNWTDGHVIRGMCTGY